MNEKPSPSRWDDAQAAPEALGALLARFPAYAFESECQRSLDMIVLCQRYISRLVEEQNGPQADELRQSLSDLAVAANRLDRNLGSLTSLLRCVQQTEAPVWEPVELCAGQGDVPHGTFFGEAGLIDHRGPPCSVSGPQPERC